ncbi:sulfurtransferase-like selenium metabolism protein YedF [Enorma phocaeensis]|uniref:sulfurtransferase-like selenium metabolism protein YedF n=1 Tax=Enorma phocaeensis TaxID=1871019 RepID=UPI002357F337|nr:sulfurtransferase-like selenium metabolism protein YedF [Enorma phocaeensis]
MSERFDVDAVGDACPIPVVKTLKALRGSAAGDTVATTVDNEVAVQNLFKMAKEKGCSATSEQIADDRFVVTIEVGAGVAVASGEEDAVSCEVAEPESASGIVSGYVVAISSATMGSGSDELGSALMKSFIYALGQQEILPETILFYNGGAHLTCTGSESLEDLRSFAEQGVEILTCGTCLNYYGITDELAVGDVTNMYVIVEKLSQARRIVKP